MNMSRVIRYWVMLFFYWSSVDNRFTKNGGFTKMPFLTALPLLCMIYLSGSPDVHSFVELSKLTIGGYCYFLD